MKKLIKTSRGETLAETLVALLIVAVSMTALANMITTASRITKSGEGSTDSYYHDKNVMIEAMNDFATHDEEDNYEPIGITAGTIDTVLKSDGMRVMITDEEFKTTNVNFYTMGRENVVAYRIKEEDITPASPSQLGGNNND